MATELQNKIWITNGDKVKTEYVFNETVSQPFPSTDPNGDKPIASSYIYELQALLNGFLGRQVTNKIQAGNINVPTSEAVYTKVQNLSNLDPANIPDGCVLVFRHTDGNLYYQSGDSLIKINITGGPVVPANVTYNETYHSLIYGASQINASEAIDDSEIE